MNLDNIDFEKLAYYSDLMRDVEEFKKEGKKTEKEIEQYIAFKKEAHEFNKKYKMIPKKQE